MTNDLRTQLQMIVADVFAPDDAAEKAIVHVRRRRRLAGGAVALAAIGALIAIPIAIAGTSDSQRRPATLVPPARLRPRLPLPRAPHWARKKSVH